jgi:hypothetical protein
MITDPTGAEIVANFRLTAQTIEDQYHDNIRSLGIQARNVILPYFRKKRWTYKTGNGDWWIRTRSGRKVEGNKLPEWVRSLLWIEVGHNDLLGYHIEEI